MNPSFELGFDPATTTPIEFLGEKKEPMLPGTYPARVTSAIRKSAKEHEGGWYWQLAFTVEGGEYDGRHLFVRYNIVNTKSSVAEEIGRGQMTHYLHTIGRLAPQSVADLCGVPVLITVGTRKNSFTGRNGEVVEGIVNEIVKIEPCTHTAQPEAVPF